MTGFGKGEAADDRFRVAVELRAVNNRYLKINIRGADVVFGLDSFVEREIRKAVHRGTVTATIKVSDLQQAGQFRLSEPAVTAYWEQLQKLSAGLHLSDPEDITPLLSLPGAVEDHTGDEDISDAIRPLLQQALGEALKHFNEFRRTEGEAMAAELLALCDTVAGYVRDVEKLAPQVVEAYRDRILERVSELLKHTDVSVEPKDVVREVSIHADRCDIHEELTRLDSHLQQFAAFVRSPQSQGRKLDFLTQEIFREMNTIGSKANNVEIAHCVVEMKAVAEKMREILQNAE